MSKMNQHQWDGERRTTLERVDEPLAPSSSFPPHRAHIRHPKRLEIALATLPYRRGYEPAWLARASKFSGVMRWS